MVVETRLAQPRRGVSRQCWRASSSAPNQSRHHESRASIATPLETAREPYSKLVQAAEVEGAQPPPAFTSAAMRATTPFLLLRPTPACQLCEHVLAQSSRQRRSLATPIRLPAVSSSQRHAPPTVPSRRRATAAAFPRAAPSTPRNAAPAAGASSAQDAAAEVAKAQELGSQIINATGIPPEDAILAALQACEAGARRLLGLDDVPAAATSPDGVDTSPASALLDLDSRPPPSASARIAVDLLSNLAYEIIAHPTVFITPKVLGSYVRTQALLQRPQTFPEAFALYASKPVPQPNTNPLRYKLPNPRKASAAVPSATADTALSAAIRARDLVLALAVIETTFRQPSFRRARILRRALLPGTGLALAPAAAYALAARFAGWQTAMEPGLATGVAFAGTLAYVGATATIGLVALTTANDQMDRVTWATGLPLRQRWLREEERAAVDRVAAAWGFRDVLRRGEEEGEEWDALREWIGVREMVLDKVELMEGME